MQRCPKESKREELLQKCCSLHTAEDFLPILLCALAVTQSMKTHLFVRSQDAEDKVWLLKAPSHVCYLAMFLLYGVVAFWGNTFGITVQSGAQ